MKVAASLFVLAMAGALAMTFAACARGPGKPPAVMAPGATGPGLQGRVAALARAHRGQVALFARHLGTGATVELQPDREVRTASAIKLAVLVEAFHQVKEGAVALAAPITLRDEDKVAGSGVLPLLHGGLELTLEDALALMIALSDNTATNLAIDRLGGVGAVNRRLAALGYRHTHLYKKIYVPATEPMPADQPQFGLGKTTARELARLMESVARCELGDPALCRRMLHMLRNQQLRYHVARYIETADTTETPSAVAAKLGELDAARIEVALVAARSGPIVIAAFTWDNADQRYSPENEAAILIGRLAEAIVREWSPDGVRTGEP
ncbi:MAG TPA: serine hydrolase [Kofleriaceae bacterium]|nr:serine hydrolase [Kofleriaceae bacterium]